MSMQHFLGVGTDLTGPDPNIRARHVAAELSDPHSGQDLQYGPGRGIWTCQVPVLFPGGYASEGEDGSHATPSVI